MRRQVERKRAKVYLVRRMEMQGRVTDACVGRIEHLNGIRQATEKAEIDILEGTSPLSNPKPLRITTYCEPVGRSAWPPEDGAECRLAFKPVIEAHGGKRRGSSENVVQQGH
ncbi:MAG: hypothetical protein HY508_14225 [Acidobacteria bacterium]|nr:hypothetical protein [Acidobacteriota bacterium]